MKFKNINQIVAKYKDGDEFFLAQFEASALYKKPHKIKPIKVKLVINESDWFNDIYFETVYGTTRKSPYSEFCGNDKFIIGDTLEEVKLKYNAVKSQWIKKRISYLESLFVEEIDSLVDRFDEINANTIEIVGNTVEEKISIEKFKKQLYNNIVS